MTTNMTITRSMNSNIKPKKVKKEVKKDDKKSTEGEVPKVDPDKKERDKIITSGKE